MTGEYQDEYAPAQVDGPPAGPARCQACREPLESDGHCWRCDLGCPFCGTKLDADGFCSGCVAITPRNLHPLLPNGEGA